MSPVVGVFTITMYILYGAHQYTGGINQCPTIYDGGDMITMKYSREYIMRLVLSVTYI